MSIVRASVGRIGIGTLTLLLALVACQSAPVPATSTPAATAIAGDTAIAPSATPATVVPPAIVTPIASATPAPAGSMAAMSQMMRQMGEQMGGMMAGEVSASQMQQMMDQVAATSRQIAQLTLQASQGAPETRQMMAQTLDQLAALATALRERAPELTPEQRKLAMEQMQVVSLNLAQLMSQMQDTTAQPSAADQQSIIGQLQQLQSTMSYMMTQYGIATPTPIQPTPTRSP